MIPTIKGDGWIFTGPHCTKGANKFDWLYTIIRRDIGRLGDWWELQVGQSNRAEPLLRVGQELVDLAELPLEDSFARAQLVQLADGIF